jgi:hypothetical protein
MHIESGEKKEEEGQDGNGVEGKSESEEKEGSEAETSDGSRMIRGRQQQTPRSVAAGPIRRAPARGRRVAAIWKRVPRARRGISQASKDDRRVVLKSATSGKMAVHKPKAMYFT